MKTFLTFFIVAAALSAAASCSPLSYSVDLQMRYPSSSGVDPVGKSISVVYLQDGGYRDSLFNNCLADGLAQGLERSYFGSEKAVEVYDVLVCGDEDYSQKDSLVSLLMTTGTDIVMLLDRPAFGDPAGGKVPVSSGIYVYDSMDRRDTVRTLTLDNSVSAEASERSMFPSDAMYMGLKAAEAFDVKWVPESYTIIYFDQIGEPQWDEANKAVEALDWRTAAKYWMELASVTDNACRCSCAAYNLAVACLMDGEPSLALEWLDFSDKTYPISLSQSLRGRIKSRL